MHHGTYDLFHKGHLENLLEAAANCKRLIVGVKSDELVREHKKKNPILSANERAEILKHFKFVSDTYIYYTRNLLTANNYIESLTGHKIDAVYLGSDLEEDFKKYKNDLNIIFTRRDPEVMKERSTTAYSKKYKKLRLDVPASPKYKGCVHAELVKKSKKDDKEREI